MTRGWPGHAARITSRGTRRPAYRRHSATTMTSSRGPITGRNSGMRSIGLATHIAANTTAILARVGTAGSRRSLHMRVAQSGSSPTRSRARPGGSRRASRYMDAQAITRRPSVIVRIRIPTCTTTSVTTFGTAPALVASRVVGLGRECELGVDGLKLDRGGFAEAPLAPAAVVGPFDPGHDP